MFGAIFKLISEKWRAYKETIEIQRSLIKTLLKDRQLVSGSYTQTVEVNEDGTLRSTVHFFFSDDRVKRIFLKEGVEELTNNIIANYEPVDSCKCSCHMPIMSNVIPFPYLHEDDYYDE